jgi:hypothetical protein
MIRAAVMIHAGAVLSTVIVVLARCKAAQEDHLWVTDDAAGTITKFDASGRRLMMAARAELRSQTSTRWPRELPAAPPASAVCSRVSHAVGSV